MTPTGYRVSVRLQNAEPLPNTTREPPAEADVAPCFERHSVTLAVTTLQPPDRRRGDSLISEVPPPRCCMSRRSVRDR
jgi:hypothetical protein